MIQNQWKRVVSLYRHQNVFYLLISPFLSRHHFFSIHFQSIGFNIRHGWILAGGAKQATRWSGGVTSPDQRGILSADSAPAASGPGWVVSGRGPVSGGWPAGPCCRSSGPGTQTETDTAAAAVRLSGEGKADLCNHNNNITGHWTATRSASLAPLSPATTWWHTVNS